MSSPVIKSFWPALVLYAVKTIAVLVIALPLFVYFNEAFGFSRLADDLWPVPGGLMLAEFLWSSRDLFSVIILLSLIVGLLYFLIVQFIYGGICASAFDIDSSPKQGFLEACGRYFKGFIKIAITAILPYIFIISLGDLIGRFLSALFTIVLGETAGWIVRLVVILLAIFILAGYLINLRFIQIQNNNSSLRFAIASSKKIFGKLKYFLALNILTGFMTLASMTMLFYVMILITRLEFGLIAFLLMLAVQQFMIFTWSYFEAFQINLNVKLFKE